MQPPHQAGDIKSLEANMKPQSPNMAPTIDMWPRLWNIIKFSADLAMLLQTICIPLDTWQWQLSKVVERSFPSSLDAFLSATSLWVIIPLALIAIVFPSFLLQYTSFVRKDETTLGSRSHVYVAGSLVVTASLNVALGHISQKYDKTLPQIISAILLGLSLASLSGWINSRALRFYLDPPSWTANYANSWRALMLSAPFLKLQVLSIFLTTQGYQQPMDWRSMIPPYDVHWNGSLQWMISVLVFLFINAFASTIRRFGIVKDPQTSHIEIEESSTNNSSTFIALHNILLAVLFPFVFVDENTVERIWDVRENWTLALWSLLSWISRLASFIAYLVVVSTLVEDIRRWWYKEPLVTPRIWTAAKSRMARRYK